MNYSRIFRIAILSLFACLYFTSQTIAGVVISKSVSIDELAAAPQNLTFYIYEFKDDSEPTLTQQFEPGEWQFNGEIEEDTERLRFKVTLNDLEQFSGAQVWVQMEVDGVLTGALTPLASNEPGISVEGFVESRALGFKFPDGTTQTTAAGGGDDLGNHIATQNIRLGSFWLSGDGGNEGLQVDTSGKVGIATAPGTANLQVAGIDGVVFTGSIGDGVIPTSGDGTRMMWYPRKTAFRAGHVNADQWDDANIGFFSIAFGIDTTASGDSSTAMGRDTLASGESSTAMGEFTIANGYRSTSMGNGTTAGGAYSTAMGRNTSSPSYGETVIGTFNTNYTPTSTSNWSSNDRLFVIGNGANSSNRSNAMVVQKNGNTTLNGKVGIATAPGTANLQVAGIDGVVFTGTFNSGAIPASGDGTRMMWHPRKAAFRAGHAEVGAWDDANIGVYSVAFGRGTTASGRYSTAMGESTIASGFANSTAMGFSTTSSGIASTAMGSSTTASGDFSTSMGRQTSAPSYSETVIGAFNTIYTPISTSSWQDNDRLFIIGNGVDDINPSDAMVVLKNGNTTFNGTLQLNALGIAGGTDICRNASNVLALCSSSGRYKDNVEPLKLGLETVRQLQPVMFDWKASGQHDLGFVAEDVGAIDPLLVIHNSDGEIEGVKYKQLTAVLVNAVQTQQTQYAGLQSRNAELHAQTVSLQSQTMELKARNTELQSNYEQLQAEVATMREQQQQYARMVMEIKQQLEQRPLLTSVNLN